MLQRRTLSLALATALMLAFLHGSAIASGFDDTGDAGLAQRLAKSGLLPRRHVNLVLSSGATLQGSFVRFDDDGGSFALRRFLGSKQRFSMESVNLDDLQEVRLVKKHSSDRHPLLGMLFGAAAGAGIGYLAGERPGIGCTDYDTRLIYAGGGFALGSVTGFLVGAVVAPHRTTENVIWTRE